MNIILFFPLITILMGTHNGTFFQSQIPEKMLNIALILLTSWSPIVSTMLEWNLWYIHKRTHTVKTSDGIVKAAIFAITRQTWREKMGVITAIFPFQWNFNVEHNLTLRRSWHCVHSSLLSLYLYNSSEIFKDNWKWSNEKK